jgi:hypothetical protein
VELLHYLAVPIIHISRDSSLSLSMPTKLAFFLLLYNLHCSRCDAHLHISPTSNAPQ